MSTQDRARVFWWCLAILAVCALPHWLNHVNQIHPPAGPVRPAPCPKGTR